MYNLAIVHLFAFRRTCSQHHLELILIGNIQHFHDLPVRHSFISIKRHIHFRFFRSARLQERSQFFQRNRLLLIISKRRVKIQVLIDNNPRKGLADVCCFPCGSNTLIAFGETTVDVIIKKISNRKMTSVMDAILKLGDILALRCSTLSSIINY